MVTKRLEWTGSARKTRSRKSQLGSDKRRVSPILISIVNRLTMSRTAGIAWFHDTILFHAIRRLWLGAIHVYLRGGVQPVHRLKGPKKCRSRTRAGTGNSEIAGGDGRRFNIFDENKQHPNTFYSRISFPCRSLFLFFSSSGSVPLVQIDFASRRTIQHEFFLIDQYPGLGGSTMRTACLAKKGEKTWTEKHALHE